MGYLVVRDENRNTDSEDAWIRGADDRNCQTCKNTISAVFQDLLEPAHENRYLFVCGVY